MVSYIKSNKMKTKCIHKDLIFYLDNELSVEKRTAVEKHLEECADCRSFLAFLKEGLQVIEKEKNQEASPYFYTRLSARLDEKNGTSGTKSMDKTGTTGIFLAYAYCRNLWGIEIRRQRFIAQSKSTGDQQRPNAQRLCS